MNTNKVGGSHAFGEFAVQERPTNYTLTFPTGGMVVYPAATPETNIGNINQATAIVTAPDANINNINQVIASTEATKLASLFFSAVAAAARLSNNNFADDLNEIMEECEVFDFTLPDGTTANDIIAGTGGFTNTGAAQQSTDLAIVQRYLGCELRDVESAAMFVRDQHVNNLLDDENGVMIRSWDALVNLLSRNIANDHQDDDDVFGDAHVAAATNNQDAILNNDSVAPVGGVGQNGLPDVSDQVESPSVALFGSWDSLNQDEMAEYTTADLESPSVQNDQPPVIADSSSVELDFTSMDFTSMDFTSFLDGQSSRPGVASAQNAQSSEHVAVVSQPPVLADSPNTAFDPATYDVNSFEPASMDFTSMDFSSMDFSSMDFSSMDFSSMDFSSMDFSSMDFSSMDFTSFLNGQSSEPGVASSQNAQSSEHVAIVSRTQTTHSTMANYNSLKVAELKKLLYERGLRQSGKKADLIAHLQDDDRRSARGDDASVQTTRLLEHFATYQTTQAPQRVASFQYSQSSGPLVASLQTVQSPEHFVASSQQPPQSPEHVATHQTTPSTLVAASSSQVDVIQQTPDLYTGVPEPLRSQMIALQQEKAALVAKNKQLEYDLRDTRVGLLAGSIVSAESTTVAKSRAASTASNGSNRRISSAASAVTNPGVSTPAPTNNNLGVSSTAIENATVMTVEDFAPLAARNDYISPPPGFHGQPSSTSAQQYNMPEPSGHQLAPPLNVPDFISTQQPAVPAGSTMNVAVNTVFVQPTTTAPVDTATNETSQASSSRSPPRREVIQYGADGSQMQWQGQDDEAELPELNQLIGRSKVMHKAVKRGLLTVPEAEGSKKRSNPDADDDSDQEGGQPAKKRKQNNSKPKAVIVPKIYYPFDKKMFYMRCMLEGAVMDVQLKQGNSKQWGALNEFLDGLTERNVSRDPPATFTWRSWETFEENLQRLREQGGCDGEVAAPAQPMKQTAVASPATRGCGTKGRAAPKPRAPRKPRAKKGEVAAASQQQQEQIAEPTELNAVGTSSMVPIVVADDGEAVLQVADASQRPPLQQMPSVSILNRRMAAMNAAGQRTQQQQQETSAAATAHHHHQTQRFVPVEEFEAMRDEMRRQHAQVLQFFQGRPGERQHLQQQQQMWFGPPSQPGRPNPLGGPQYMPPSVGPPPAAGSAGRQQYFPDPPGPTGS
ncbi:hypothetical protein B0H66DRAFT_605842 [Apodospora peruviana]|uniref:SAP domain-containing protein n=1 Tax=Apodospora peruviana TaxID=516989 RepID=A0AAE0HYE9_9PEZI|nr:hypothetical protein B0H66DRAFT_605842 [Apodospora peruviana]